MKKGNRIVSMSHYYNSLVAVVRVDVAIVFGLVSPQIKGSLDAALDASVANPASAMLTTPRQPVPIVASRGSVGDVSSDDRAPAFSLAAPAKVNLFLEITGKREDGYHGLETVMAPLRLADRLTLSPRPAEEGIRLSIVGPLAQTANGEPIPQDQRNLVVRVLDLVQQHVGKRFGANILLEKHVPAEAGLGGGSSDAAAALLLANHAWRLGLSDEDLQGIAEQVGSDVPFFLQSGAAIGRGRGEIIEPLPTPTGCPCVVVKPQVGMPTAKVYSQIAGQTTNLNTESAGSLVAALAAGEWKNVARQQFNRLQPFAFQITESLRITAKQLSRLAPLDWMMTGSGSAFFALAPNTLAAQRVAATARRRRLGWAVATRLG